MIQKAVAMRALRVVLMVLALAFCVWSLASQWDDTVHAFEQMSWYTLLGAFALGFAGLVAWMLAWRTFLSGLGSELPVGAAYRIAFVSGLGKYVPGMVWVLVSQVEMAREYKVPRARSFSATVLAIATSTACGLAVAAVTLPLTSPEARDRYWWLFLLAPVLLACLHPKIVTWSLNLVLKAVRRPPLEHPVSIAATLRAVLWTVAGWILFGGHLWLLSAAAGGTGAGLPFLATGAYSLAFVAGLLVFLAPGGLGAREAVMVLVLSPVLPAGAPIVVALASRVLLTAADLIGAAGALLLGRRGRKDPGAGNEPAPAGLSTSTQPTGTRPTKEQA
ncbi:lysylphosphatidylglycerol synthase domain-containing protein [Actinomadura gamaensis]|uniref:Lysylphosphatidylglycerol synthase domain-containing protein n=1 Tax=Actinomadura gamaensis TaxID=1763541 RepID=A0ABV9U1Z7_9ACTN